MPRIARPATRSSSRCRRPRRDLPRPAHARGRACERLQAAAPNARARVRGGREGRGVEPSLRLLLAAPAAAAAAEKGVEDVEGVHAGAAAAVL